MANIATAEFAAAVSNAGGIGVIGTGAMNVEQAREAIQLGGIGGFPYLEL